MTCKYNYKSISLRNDTMDKLSKLSVSNGISSTQPVVKNTIETMAIMNDISFFKSEFLASVAVIFNKSDMKNPYRICEIFYSTTLGTTKNSPAVSGAFFKT